MEIQWRASPIVGRWKIIGARPTFRTEMEPYARGDCIEFSEQGRGAFSFALVRARLNWRPATRDTEPAAEWWWEGTSELEEGTIAVSSEDEQRAIIDVLARYRPRGGDIAQDFTGRGFAVLRGNELHGTISGSVPADFTATRYAVESREFHDLDDSNIRLFSVLWSDNERVQ